MTYKKSWTAKEKKDWKTYIGWDKRNDNQISAGETVLHMWVHFLRIRKMNGSLKSSTLLKSCFHDTKCLQVWSIMLSRGATFNVKWLVARWPDT